MISIIKNIGEKYSDNPSYLWRLTNFLLFLYQQDTEYESLEMEIDLSGPILTQKKHQILHGSTISKLYKIVHKNYGKYSYLWR